MNYSHFRIGSRILLPNANPQTLNGNTSLIDAARAIHQSSVLFAEPLKKKKKIDPAVIKARDERKKKKLEKQIRRLEKNARQLKAIDELEVPLVLIDEKAYVSTYNLVPPNENYKFIIPLPDNAPGKWPN